MTGGLGFVSDMANRDKANKGALRDMNDRHKRAVKAHAQHTHYEDIEIQDDIDKCPESTRLELEKIRKEAKRNRLKERIMWSILGTVLLLLFLFLISKIS